MTLYLVGPSAEQLITTANQELKLLHHWCVDNRLTINIDKTFYMLFTNKKIHHLPELIINNCKINRTDKQKFLGVTFDEPMEFMSYKQPHPKDFKTHCPTVSNQRFHATICSKMYLLCPHLPTS